MKINTTNDTLTLECSGRRIDVTEIAISASGETAGSSMGSDESEPLCVSESTNADTRAWYYFDNHATDVEKRELAVHMMRRWAKYGGIADDSWTLPGVLIFDLDLSKEKG